MSENELNTLMYADPLKLSKSPEQRAVIIAYFRENRGRFLSGNKSAGKPAKAPKEKVSLADLDLDL